MAIEANERGSWRAVGKAIMDPVEGTTVVVRCSAPAMVETKTINTIGPDGLPCVQYEISFKPITRPFTPPPSAPKRTTLVPPRRAGQEDTSSESAPASTPRIDASSHSPSPTEEPRTPRRCNSPPLPEVDSPLAGKGKGGEGGGLGLTDLGTRLAALQPVHDDWHGYESYLADAYGSDILSLPPTPAVQPTSSPLTFAAAPAAAPHVSIVAPPVTKMSPLAKRRCGSMGARQLFLGFEGMQLTTRGPPTSMEEAELALLTTSSSVNEVSRWSETETEGTGSDTVAETPAEVTRAFFGV